MSRWIAVAAALAGALLFGMSAVAEQRGTKLVRNRRTLSPRILLDLVRQPVWVLGIGGLIAGFVLQVVALSFGSLALVEPILVCDLVFAVLISACSRRSRDPVVFAGVAACTAGIAGFLAVARPSGGQPDATWHTFLALAAGYGALLAGCLAVAGRSQRLRPLALALAAGASYGVTAFLIKLVTGEFSGLPQLVTSWPVYALAIIAPLGFLLNQDAYQQGSMIAPVLAIITSADPLISILLASVLLNEKLSTTPAGITGEIVSLALMTTGIFVIAHHSPQVTRPAAKAASEQPQQHAR